MKHRGVAWILHYSTVLPPAKCKEGVQLFRLDSSGLKFRPSSKPILTSDFWLLKTSSSSEVQLKVPVVRQGPYRHILL